MDVNKCVKSIRDVAIRLLEIAAELDPPRTMEETGTCTCNRCGDRVEGTELLGLQCRMGLYHGTGCQGFYELDPQVRTFETSRSNTCTCDVCGDQIAGMRWIGEPCIASGMCMKPCLGRYRLDPEPETEDKPLLACDGCGREGRAQEGDRCWHNLRGERMMCSGHFRLIAAEPDEELIASDGRSLGITRDELALQQAVRDFVRGDTEDVPDMASTYRGRPR